MTALPQKLLISGATLFFSIYYVQAYLVSSEYPSWTIWTIVLLNIFISLALLRRRSSIARGTMMPLYRYVIILLILYLLVNSAALTYYAPLFLQDHFFSVQLFALWHLAKIIVFYAAFTLGVFLLGDHIVRRFYSFSLRWSSYPYFAIAIGLFFIALYYYILALLGLVYHVSVIPLIVIAIINIQGWKTCRKYGQGLIRILAQPITVWSMRGFFILSLAILLAILFVKNGLPIVAEGDSLALYFTLPNLILQHHELIRFPYWPLGDSLIAFSFIYIPILTFGQAVLNHVSLYFFLLTLPLLYIFLRGFISATNTWLGLWVFLTIPFHISFFLLTPKIDHLTIYLALIIIVLWQKFVETPQIRLGVLLGATMGFVVAVKYNVLLLLPGLFLLPFVVERQNFRSIINRFFKPIILVIIIALVTFGLWGVRNYTHHGNVFYPYAGGQLYDYLITSESDEHYLNAYYQEHDYYNANFGFSYNLVENISNFFSYAISHASFNYGLLFVLVLISFFLFPRFTAREKLYSGILIAIWVVWYLLIRTEAHYVDFVLPLMVLMATKLLSYLNRTLLWIVIGLICILAVHNFFISPIYATLFISRVKTASDASEIFVAYMFTDVMDAIIDQNPDAVFLPITSIVPIPRDSHKHSFINTRLFYSALVFHRASTPSEAIDQFKQDGITHIFTDDKLEDYVFGLCLKRNKSCPVFSDFNDKVKAMLPLLQRVAYDIDTQVSIYEL